MRIGWFEDWRSRGNYPCIHLGFEAWRLRDLEDSRDRQFETVRIWVLPGRLIRSLPTSRRVEECGGTVNRHDGAPRHPSSFGDVLRRGSLPSASRQTIRSSAISRSNMALNSSHSATKLSTRGSRPRLTSRANWLKFEPILLTAPVSDPKAVRTFATAARSRREARVRLRRRAFRIIELTDSPRFWAIRRMAAASSGLMRMVTMLVRCRFSLPLRRAIRPPLAEIR